MPNFDLLEEKKNIKMVKNVIIKSYGRMGGCPVKYALHATQGTETIQCQKYLISVNCARVKQLSVQWHNEMCD